MCSEGQDRMFEKEHDCLGKRENWREILDSLVTNDKNLPSAKINPMAYKLSDSFSDASILPRLPKKYPILIRAMLLLKARAGERAEDDDSQNFTSVSQC